MVSSFADNKKPWGRSFTHGLRAEIARYERLRHSVLVGKRRAKKRRNMAWEMGRASDRMNGSLSPNPHLRHVPVPFRCCVIGWHAGAHSNTASIPYTPG